MTLHNLQLNDFINFHVLIYDSWNIKVHSCQSLILNDFNLQNALLPTEVREVRMYEIHFFRLALN